MAKKIEKEGRVSAARKPRPSGALQVTAESSQPAKYWMQDSKGDIWGSRQMRGTGAHEPVAVRQTIVEGHTVKGSPDDSLSEVVDETLSLIPQAAIQIQNEAPTWAGSEVRTLVQQGPSANRIDLSIAGDGYTEADKAKFFEDAEKITRELFGNDTFKTYLPLFNVHAVFVPSQEHGIGDGRPKNTALKLYRHPSIRQAIMPGDSGAARRAARLAPDSDYPILLANDKFYGGLGGEFAITSSAPLNITTVLRHELGHNFGRVGEEYDGGQVYSGANHSSSANVPWKHFVHGEQVPTHKAELLHYSAPWKNLGKGAWETRFSLKEGSDILLDFNSLGFDTNRDVELLVDGKPVQYTGEFNYDRNFYRVRLPLQAGAHSVSFRELQKDGNNILSKVGVYRLPVGYPTDKELVGAFATYNESGSFTGYRPTDSNCLMRDMSATNFCPVCVENMWRNFLKEVSLIDEVTQKGNQVSAALLPLGAERLTVEWLDPSGAVRSELTGKTQWTPDPKDAGDWTLRVTFVSDEVKDPKQAAWTVHKAKFKVAFNGAMA